MKLQGKYYRLGCWNEIELESVGGLSKREHFAALAMQGIVVHCERGVRPEDLAALMNDAVTLADALIEALNKPMPGSNSKVESF